MSNNTRPSDADASASADVTEVPPQAAPLQLGLALLYPLFAHLASMRDSGMFAALASFDVMLMMLAVPLLQRRGWAWLLLIAGAAALAWLAASRFALVPLLLMPVVFTVMIGWMFARSLRAPRQPLISRIVAALDGVTPDRLEPEIAVYTRRLTAMWAGFLAVLASVNLVLALIAVPKGLLAVFGVHAPITVSEAQWSWVANACNYGIIGGFFMLEYLYRTHRFPKRYASFLDFMRRMARIPPATWRSLLR